MPFFSNHFTYVDFNMNIQRTQFGLSTFTVLHVFSWMSQNYEKMLE